MLKVIIRNKEMIIKQCKTNCMCMDRIKRIIAKQPINELDRLFIKFQKEELVKEYIMCKNKRI